MWLDMVQTGLWNSSIVGIGLYELQSVAQPISHLMIRNVGVANCIRGSGAHSLSDALKDVPMLETLNLAGMQSCCSVLLHVQCWFWMLTSWWWSTCILFLGCDVLCEFPSNESLQSMLIWSARVGNCIGDEGAIALCAVLKNAPNLASLNLRSMLWSCVNSLSTTSYLHIIERVVSHQYAVE